jgi:prophage regulatory protein
MNILRKPEVCHRIGLSAVHIMRLVRQGRFPQPIRISDNSIGWPEHEIDAWIESRIRQRDAR